MTNCSVKRVVGALQAKQKNPRWTPAQACQRLPQPWDNHLAAHVKCLADMQSGDRCEAYTAILTAVQPFLKVAWFERS